MEAPQSATHVQPITVPCIWGTDTQYAAEDGGYYHAHVHTSLALILRGVRPFCQRLHSPWMPFSQLECTVLWNLTQLVAKVCRFVTLIPADDEEAEVIDMASLRLCWLRAVHPRKESNHAFALVCDSTNWLYLPIYSIMVVKNHISFHMHQIVSLPYSKR